MNKYKNSKPICDKCDKAMNGLYYRSKYENGFNKWNKTKIYYCAECDAIEWIRGIEEEKND